VYHWPLKNHRNKLSKCVSAEAIRGFPSLGRVGTVVVATRDASRMHSLAFVKRSCSNLMTEPSSTWHAYWKTPLYKKRCLVGSHQSKHGIAMIVQLPYRKARGTTH